MAEAARVLSESPPKGLLARIGYLRRHRMWTPRYWMYAVRYLWRFKLWGRHIRTRGMVFVSRGAEVRCTRGLARMELGRGVWIGKGTSVQCHEGWLRVGDRVVLGGSNTINAYLDVEVGEDCIFADWIYVTDFDHRYQDVGVRIQDQGIVMSPVRIGADCWIGEKVSVLRGSTIGRGSVIGAQTVVKGDIPPYSVAVGSPARVVRRRGERKKKEIERS